MSTAKVEHDAPVVQISASMRMDLFTDLVERYGGVLL